MKWYKRDPDAALSGMAELSFEECGAYNSLIDLLYSRDGLVPDDDAFCARCFHCNPRTWRKLKNRLIARGKVRSIDGMLTANKVEETIFEASIISERQRNRARMRWERAKKTNANNGAAMQPGNAYHLNIREGSSFPTAAREGAAQKSGRRESKSSEKSLAEIVKAKGWTDDDR
jgi:uncharacterized protein YdaU (DUF1376 family)